jgi:hypothetical protein
MRSIFSYQSVALSGSAAYAATSARGRPISISVTTSTRMAGYAKTGAGRPLSAYRFSCSMISPHV